VVFLVDGLAKTKTTLTFVWFFWFLWSPGDHQSQVIVPRSPERPTKQKKPKVCLVFVKENKNTLRFFWFSGFSGRWPSKKQKKTLGFFCFLFFVVFVVQEGRKPQR